MSSYSFSVDHFLAPEEIAALAERCLPHLLAFGRRNLPEIHVGQSIPDQPAYLDVLRTSWWIDSNADRPAHDLRVQGLGYAFGVLLERRYSLQWCQIKDVAGTSISLVSKGQPQVYVPVFNYLQKREDLQSAEVFEDFFEQVGPALAGANNSFKPKPLRGSA